MPTIIALYHLSFITVSFLQDNPASDFNELGMQLLWGFVLAVVVAIAFTFIKLRLQNKKPRAQFISISSSQSSDEKSKVPGD